MGFLSPIFLLAGLAVAVPLILHLFHRHDAKKMVFPALQYLLRTEKEHARTSRLRQLLLSQFSGRRYGILGNAIVLCPTGED